MKQVVRIGNYWLINIMVIAWIFLCTINADPNEIPGIDEIIAEFYAEFSPVESRAGEKHRLVISSKIRRGWHIYSVLPQGEDAPPPTVIEINSRFLIPDGPLYESRPITELDKVIGIRLSYHKNQALFFKNFRIPEKTASGSYTFQVEVTFQGCNERICLPPKTISLKPKLVLRSGSPRQEFLYADRSIDALADGPINRELFDMLAGGVWEFILLAALMGLAALFTPCVFPMIPITVSYFSHRAEGKQSALVKLAVIFSLGIVITYTGTGLLMSVLFGAGSALELASDPFVNLLIAIVFIVFAFSLMGFFNITLPPALANYFNQRAQTGTDVASVLLMGFVFTLTAFTCTVQFVGTMLIAASQGETLWPLIGMLVFSLVFSFPFFLLAIAPGLIKRLKGASGVWLLRTKVVLGILELMASLKFLSNVDLIWQTGWLSRDRAIIIWLILLGCVVGYLAWTNLKDRTNRSLNQWIATGLFAVLFGLTYRGLGNQSLGSLIDATLPPAGIRFVDQGEMVSQKESEELIWLDSLAEAHLIAAGEKKMILLEFTGYTCVNCRWMEQHILRLRSVHELIKAQYVPVRLYTDSGQYASEYLQMQIDRFKTVALPFYVILTHDNQVIVKFSGISLDQKEFIDFLLSGIRK